jgi:[acyl-carrier-protein] S-malonyltransferase
MKKTAFIYPGQGSQSVGMGVSIYENFDEAKKIFNTASDIAGYDVLALCAEGPIEKLSRTVYTQPALYTVESAITEVLKSRGINPSCTAGHSLGEFAAWFAAGAFTFGDGFRLVSERGKLMDCADPDNKGTMAAVIGLDYDIVAEACKSAGGTVVVANINSPGQIVISGEKDAVARAGEILKEKGAKRVLPLNVSGAFHSPLMECAKKSFAEFAAKINISDAVIPVYSNFTASPILKSDEIRNAMIQQLTSPVRWIESVQKMAEDGISEAFEAGPGNVLAGLVKRIDENITVKPVSDFNSINEALNGKA